MQSDNSAETWVTPSPTPAAEMPVPRAGLPGSVVFAAVVLLVMGSLIALFAVFMGLAGSMFTSIGDPGVFGAGFESGMPPDALDAAMNLAGGFILAITVVLLIIAGAHFVTGVGILKRRDWGRIAGLVLSVLALLVLGMGIGSSLASLGQPIPVDTTRTGLTAEQIRDMTTSGAVFGIVISLVIFAGYAGAAFVLARRGDVFG